MQVLAPLHAEAGIDIRIPSPEQVPDPLLTLEHLGYVTVEDRKFALTPRILELGYAYLSGTPLWNLALPYMEEVAEQTRESCSVSVLEGADIVYILRLSTHKVMTINLAVGSRLPAWVTSMGRVLLAGLPAAELDRVLAMSQIQAYTKDTVTDIGALKAILAGVRADGAPPLTGGSVIFGRKHLTGSAIGGMAETQEMMDFCAEHGIVSDVEMIDIRNVNEAWERMAKNDVRYRFVIDMATMKNAA